MNAKRRDLISSNSSLSNRQIASTVKAYTAGTISDTEMTAFIREIYENGLSFQQASVLTDAMAKSGQVFKFPPSLNRVVDKHSTGGVGDKITLIFAPLCAASGLKVGKVSGRALGHTGGTIDKLESIPGFHTDIDRKVFLSCIRKTGVSVIAQTGETVPADKKIYALRDRTGMVDSVPLIAASIMSKKVAAGAKHLVLDVKTGCGAFMREERDALELARFMLGIAKHSQIKAAAVISDMNQPLGHAIGNRLEVKEAYAVLNGEGPADLEELSVKLVLEAHQTFGQSVAKADIKHLLRDGSAAKIFRAWVSAQGGDIEFLDQLAGNYLKSVPSTTVIAPISGRITGSDTHRIGVLIRDLEATSGDERDLDDAGAYLFAKIGDRVKKGEPMAQIYAHGARKRNAVAKMMLDCLHVSRQASEKAGSTPEAGARNGQLKLIKKVVRNF